MNKKMANERMEWRVEIEKIREAENEKEREEKRREEKRRNEKRERGKEHNREKRRRNTWEMKSTKLKTKIDEFTSII